MRLVLLESPYAGAVERNTRYAIRAALDCLRRGEAPMVSHLLYTRVLNDDDPPSRQLGIDAGLAWRTVCEYSVVYRDYGISEGMSYGIRAATRAGLAVLFRNIGPNPEPPYDSYEPPAHGWTCFHCGETFRTEAAARDHFGDRPTYLPACSIPSYGDARTSLVRSLEARVVELEEALQALQR